MKQAYVDDVYADYYDYEETKRALDALLHLQGNYSDAIGFAKAPFASENEDSKSSAEEKGSFMQYGKGKAYLKNQMMIVFL